MEQERGSLIVTDFNLQVNSFSTEISETGCFCQILTQSHSRPSSSTINTSQGSSIGILKSLKPYSWKTATTTMTKCLLCALLCAGVSLSIYRSGKPWGRIPPGPTCESLHLCPHKGPCKLYTPDGSGQIEFQLRILGFRGMVGLDPGHTACYCRGGNRARTARCQHRMGQVRTMSIVGKETTSPTVSFLVCISSLTLIWLLRSGMHVFWYQD